MYEKLSGMTGTADTEAYEFQEIYGLETIVIPPNKKNQRTDKQDQVYKTDEEKYGAMLNDIKDCYERGQPVLVGTTSIENSELLSGILTKAGLPHNVLNAKQHAREAEIVAQAGRPKMITIATNMAGRGTDIVLGGNVEKQIEFLLADDSIPEDQKEAKISQLRNEWQSLHDFVLAQGGLHIIALNGMNPVVSTISCEAVLPVRVTRVPPAFICLWTISCCVFLPVTRCVRLWNA